MLLLWFSGVRRSFERRRSLHVRRVDHSGRFVRPAMRTLPYVATVPASIAAIGTRADCCRAAAAAGSRHLPTRDVIASHVTLISGRGHHLLSLINNRYNTRVCDVRHCDVSTVSLC